MDLRLSIIIPFYNVERFISECLDSVFNQDIPLSEYEVICVNDGSPDHSRDIVLQYMERFPNLRLAYEAMNRGGNMPCVLNAANEVVNLAFRQGRCGFLQMSDIINQTMVKATFIAKPTYDDYVNSDAAARRLAESLL